MWDLFKRLFRLFRKLASFRKSKQGHEPPVHGWTAEGEELRGHLRSQGQQPAETPPSERISITPEPESSQTVTSSPGLAAEDDERGDTEIKHLSANKGARRTRAGTTGDEEDMTETTGRPRVRKPPTEADQNTVGKKGPGENQPPRPARIESPFVELTLTEVKVYLVLPPQRIPVPEGLKDSARELSYVVNINNTQQLIPTRIRRLGDDILEVEERRLELGCPLRKFEVRFPDELKGRKYSYRHRDKRLYVFIPVGYDKARMHDLNRWDGGPNPIPQRDVWVLLHEAYEAQPEPHIAEERWIWEHYQPVRIHLKHALQLGIRDPKSGESVEFACTPTFRLQGMDVVHDDFIEESPLFTRGPIQVIAPSLFRSGWEVWVGNKHASPRLLAKKWTGGAPLEIKVPDDLPCDCGEFQLDIREQKAKSSVSTLFFRYAPGVRLERPIDLLFPSADRGHRPELIRLVLAGGDDDWELCCNAVWKHVDRAYEIEIPATEDTVRFCLTRPGKPEPAVTLRVTIPRLRWCLRERTEKNALGAADAGEPERSGKDTSDIHLWEDRPSRLERSKLVAGVQRYLLVRTNCDSSRYVLSSALVKGDQILQEARFRRKGNLYVLTLNEFYDTIHNQTGQLRLEINVSDASSGKLLGSVYALCFPAETLDHKEAANAAPPGTIPRPPRPLVKTGHGGLMRTGKGFSRPELSKAGIKPAMAAKRSIRFDKRRKTLHNCNVQALRNLQREVINNAHRSSQA